MIGRRVLLLFLDYDPLKDANWTNELYYYSPSVAFRDTYAYIAAASLGLVLGTASVAMTLRDKVRVYEFTFSGRNVGRPSDLFPEYLQV